MYMESAVSTRRSSRHRNPPVWAAAGVGVVVAVDGGVGVLLPYVRERIYKVRSAESSVIQQKLRLPPAHCSSVHCPSCHIPEPMAEHAEPRSEHVLLPMEATGQSRKETCQRKRILIGVVVVVAAIPVLVVVCRLLLHNAGTRNGLNQVQLSTASWNDPPSTPSQTSGCVVHEKMETFSGSEEYCRSRNSRLLSEQDTKTAADCITKGEDFWAAPVRRNTSDCFIYNTDHGFVQMDCRTLRWFICLET